MFRLPSLDWIAEPFVVGRISICRWKIWRMTNLDLPCPHGHIESIEGPIVTRIAPKTPLLEYSCS